MQIAKTAAFSVDPDSFGVMGSQLRKEAGIC